MTQAFKKEWIGKELMLTMERHGKPQKITIEREDEYGNVLCRVDKNTITRLSPVFVNTLLTGKKPDLRTELPVKPVHIPAPAVVKKPAAKPTQEYGPSKRERAEAIYNRMHAKHSRKEIIGAFMEELDMTLAGASTYYQNLKSGK